ncbi:MarR family winged helix-turn-helix transcriptional regulator [Sphingomonas sp. Leaf21]|uniref:MarR family winged helix-turn-helix transcriptional regulator n=1 Tax=Sphingomonas sp. Leaf21 TaxID=2876550 RepID=UPI001E30C739|nr:MarR family transcriptional regulator [Sphingomonas sp. Leaf21]
MTPSHHDPYDPERSVGYLTKRVHQLARIALEPVFADEEVTHIQWSAMMALHYEVGSTCAELARHLCHDTGATTRILDTLEERGLVERSRSTTDRRVVRLSLTDQGKIVTDRCKDKVLASWDEWLADWSGEDVARFVGYLLRLRNKLETVA